jgi:hypothetical protein
MIDRQGLVRENNHSLQQAMDLIEQMTENPASKKSSVRWKH